MKMNTDQAWLKIKAEQEDGCFVSVGGLIEAIQDAGDKSTDSITLKHAFARLLQLRRREEALTLEDFARKADIDLGELLRIESEESYTPTPLTVDRIATFFRLPKKPLMVLAGLLTVKSPKFEEAAVRFSARSEPVEKLSSEEHQALEEYVKFLCEQ